jgi:hypothetical protein
MKFDDYFQFPWVLDMGPYTAEGIIAEGCAHTFRNNRFHTVYFSVFRIRDPVLFYPKDPG